MDAWKAGQRHQGRAKFAPRVGTARVAAIAPRGVFLTRFQNFKLLHTALGSDVLLTATKTHIAKDRAERILAQDEVIDDQLAEHMGRMIRRPSWFDAEGAVIDNDFVARIKSLRIDDEDDAHNPPRETTMNAVRLQPEAKDAGAAGGSGALTAPALQAPSPSSATAVAANADQRAAGPARGAEDRYDLFAGWLSRQIAGTRGLKSDIVDWLGIELWMLNGWISARRRMFRADVEMLADALIKHGHGWGADVLSKFDEFVIRQDPTSRGRIRRSQTRVTAEAPASALAAVGSAQQRASSESGAPADSVPPAPGAGEGRAGESSAGEVVHSTAGVPTSGSAPHPDAAEARSSPGREATTRDVGKRRAAPQSGASTAGAAPVVSGGEFVSDPVMADIVHTCRSIAATLESAMGILAQDRLRQRGKN